MWPFRSKKKHVRAPLPSEIKPAARKYVPKGTFDGPEYDYLRSGPVTSEEIQFDIDFMLNRD